MQDKWPKRKDPYNSTPIGPFHTEEERKKLKEQIPHGVHPKVMAKGHMATKSSYFVRPTVVPKDAVHPYDLTNFATQLISEVPKGVTVQERREFWEQRLFEAYFHLYGVSWNKWQLLIPWVARGDLESKAIEHGCQQPWNWTVKCRFLDSHGFEWSLEDLNYLIDRYPDRQTNNATQGIFVSDKSFAEIQVVAKELGLPTKEVLSRLIEYARALNAG